MKEEFTILLKGMFRQSGFGFSCMKKASELNIPGSLTYLDEQTIQINAQGEKLQLEELFSWCLSSRETLSGTYSSSGKHSTSGKDFYIINSL